MGATRDISREEAANMAIARPMTAARNRLLFRLKGYLGGWYVVSEGVGDPQHYRDTIDLVRSMIREDGDNPDDYEYRVDYAPPVEWVEGAVLGVSEAQGEGES